MPGEKNVLIPALSLGGYRSFGNTVQRFPQFNKINLLIGQNNCGKSNILNFIHSIYPKLSRIDDVKLDPLDNHMPSGAQFIVGVPLSLSRIRNGDYHDFNKEIVPLFDEQYQRTDHPGFILQVLQVMAKIQKAEDAWFDFVPEGRTLKIANDWQDAFEILDDNILRALLNSLTNSSGGSREWWIQQIRDRIAPKFNQVNVVIIPAIRQVGKQGSLSDEFCGEGIIERLVKLQNPDVHSQFDRNKFQAINKFLQTVTDNSSAAIEIPHERDTILVHMDGKTLPLESLGTGIHEVIILASAATILENTVICMEEPELHLNPLLQKKLISYLSVSTTNQYFISTHSAAILDTPTAEIYHVKLVNGESIVERVTSDRDKSAVCRDLGYRPSDLLQANCVIWVEGPSDRVYLNYWIKSVAPEYVEGINYSIMFYGGRLASHLSGSDPGELLDDFISLRRLNRRGVIVIDSDKGKRGARINQTKRRLCDEFNAGPGHAWITNGREIENYLPPEHVQEAIKATKPSAKTITSFTKYENILSIKQRNGKNAQASKVEVARYISETFKPNPDILDLKFQIHKLLAFIQASNITAHAPTEDN